MRGECRRYIKSYLQLQSKSVPQLVHLLQILHKCVCGLHVAASICVQTYSMTTSPPEQKFVFFFSRLNTPVRTLDQTLPLENSLIFLLQAKTKKTKKKQITLEVTDISDLSAARHQQTNKQTKALPLGSRTPGGVSYQSDSTKSTFRFTISGRSFRYSSVPLRTRTKTQPHATQGLENALLVMGCQLMDRPASFLSLLLSCVSWRVCTCPHKL